MGKALFSRVYRSPTDKLTNRVEPVKNSRGKGATQTSKLGTLLTLENQKRSTICQRSFIKLRVSGLEPET